MDGEGIKKFGGGPRAMVAAIADGIRANLPAHAPGAVDP